MAPVPGRSTESKSPHIATARWGCAGSRLGTGRARFWVGGPRSRAGAHVRDAGDACVRLGGWIQSAAATDMPCADGMAGDTAGAAGVRRRRIGGEGPAQSIREWKSGIS